MKTVFTGLILLTFSLSIFAQETTPIKGASLVCSNENAAVFFNFSEQTLWQADTVSDQEGAEFKATSFHALRCLNCFDFIVTEEWGSASYKLRGSKLYVSLRSSKGEEFPDGVTIPCKKIK